jgi:integrase
MTRKKTSQKTIDPMARQTFREVAEAFINRKEGSWRDERHGQQWRTTMLKYVYPTIGELPISSIGTKHILDVLIPIWSSAPETASRVRGRIAMILSSAEAQGMRSGENPALWRRHLDQILAKPGKLQRGHHASLNYFELPAFIAELRGREALAARALEFSILTAARTGDMISATWCEIDLLAAIWTVPAIRTKLGKEHRIPLSPRALVILKEVQPLNTEHRADATLFPATEGGELSGMAIAQLIRRMHNAARAAYHPGWIDHDEGGRLITPHGFRSSFRKWSREQTEFPNDMVELALAHRLPENAEVLDEHATHMTRLRKLMNIWAKYCASHVA